MLTLIKQLQTAYPRLLFTAGQSFYWCPESSQVFYDARVSVARTAKWSLLHETSHALLGHTSYSVDLELLQLEVAAWEHAQKLAAKYDITIQDEYIQDCLDTYRDWLYRRSLCPGCGTQCLQTHLSHYCCFNCHTRWHVSPSRFCRPYRRSTTTPQHSTVFALKIWH